MPAKSTKEIRLRIVEAVLSKSHHPNITSSKPALQEIKELEAYVMGTE